MYASLKISHVSCVHLSHSGVNGHPSFINTEEQKDELNFGLGGADQVNRAQSTVQRIKDTVSLLVRHSDTLPYWDRARCFVTFVTHTTKKKKKWLYGIKWLR